MLRGTEKDCCVCVRVCVYEEKVSEKEREQTSDSNATNEGTEEDGGFVHSARSVLSEVSGILEVLTWRASESE